MSAVQVLVEQRGGWDVECSKNRVVELACVERDVRQGWRGKEARVSYGGKSGEGKGRQVMERRGRYDMECSKVRKMEELREGK